MPRPLFRAGSFSCPFLLLAPGCAAGLECLTGPHRWPRRRICRGFAAVGVDHDSRVGLRRVSWDRCKEVAAGLGGARSCHLELGALGVELRSVRLVESEKLVANEVVARCEGRGDSALPVEVFEDLGRSPRLSG